MAKPLYVEACVIVIFFWVGCTLGDLQSDEKECADQLQSLSSCLAFVGGSAKKPTEECCSNIKQVRASNPKCLCILIKDSTNPSLGLPINQTLALEMPGLCKVDGKLSDCPAVLHISPNSPDAKIFEASNSSSDTPTGSSSSASLPGKTPPTKDTPAGAITDSSASTIQRPDENLTGFTALVAIGSAVFLSQSGMGLQFY